MKVISLDEAKNQLPAIFEQALSREIIRFRSPNGAELELTPVEKLPARTEFSADELAQSYNDPEWAAFENNAAKQATDVLQMAPWEIWTYDFPSRDRIHASSSLTWRASDTRTSIASIFYCAAPYAARSIAH